MGRKPFSFAGTRIIDDSKILVDNHALVWYYVYMEGIQMKTFAIRKGRRFIFDCDGADSKMRKYDGSICLVLHRLNSKDYDRVEVGTMYRVRFNDGFESDVFRDELYERKG